MTSIATVTGRGQITIPSLFRHHFNLSIGNRVIISRSDEIITIKPLPTEASVLDLYASINSQKKSFSPDKATSYSKKIKAKKTVLQEYSSNRK